MSAVELKIVEPIHNSGFIGNEQVACRGEITRLPAELLVVPLYFRWYSSLFAAPAGEMDRYSVNATAKLRAEDAFLFTPGVGTQVICLAASDRPGETAADQEATQHGGIAGGSEGEGKCVIHVFRANLIAPTNGAIISQTSAILAAEAPTQWGSPDYHKLNRLQYRWEFVPLGAPAGRERVDFIPDVEFDEESEPVSIRYEGPMPSTLNGAYTLTLHVEDKAAVLEGDQHSIGVTVNP